MHRSVHHWTIHSKYLFPDVRKKVEIPIRSFRYSDFKKKRPLQFREREKAKMGAYDGAQARPCSIAKRVAAVRELTFSLA